MAVRTRLGCYGGPRGRYGSFVGKEVAPTTSPHTGLFTTLSPLGISGQRRSFSPKTVVQVQRRGGGHVISSWTRGEMSTEMKLRLMNEDERILQFIMENIKEIDSFSFR